MYLNQMSESAFNEMYLLITTEKRRRERLAVEGMPPPSKEVKVMIASRMHIAAIKQYREDNRVTFGCNLRMAKEVVDKWRSILT